MSERLRTLSTNKTSKVIYFIRLANINANVYKLHKTFSVPAFQCRVKAKLEPMKQSPCERQGTPGQVASQSGSHRNK